MRLEDFQRWKVKNLQDFLRSRGLGTTGRKDELVALAFACDVMKIEPKQTPEEEEMILNKEYSVLLTVGNVRMPDPFTNLPVGWEGEEAARKKWPPTMYADMVEFMHECRVPGPDRKKLLSDYKSGKGFSYFDAKFLKQVYYHPISEDCHYCFLRANVTPSQKVNDVPHRTWVLIHKTTGHIESAYCSCMAGMFSKCNHVAAILFKVDWVWTLSDRSVTSNPCEWNQPGKKVIQPCRIGDMNIYKPQKEKSAQVRNINHVSKRLFTPKRSRNDAALTLDEWAGILYDKDDAAVAFNYAEPETTPVYSPEADLNVEVEMEVETSASVPPPLPDVAKGFLCLDSFVTYVSSHPSDVEALEEATRDQTNAEWKVQRQGRIGASVAHDCKTRMATLRKKHGNADRLVSLVLGTGPDISELPAIQYGRETEDKARKAYIGEHKAVRGHDVEVTLSGLVIHKDHPFVSASPDGLVKCECGNGLVEIKCPLSGAGKMPGEQMAFLQEVAGQLQLKRSHKYYTQCQQQLEVTGRAWCDFYVFCGEGLTFLERIYPDVEFMATSLQLVKEFWLKFVAPAMIAKPDVNDRVPSPAVVAGDHPPQFTVTVAAPPQAPTDTSRVLMKVVVNHMRNS